MQKANSLQRKNWRLFTLMQHLFAGSPFVWVSKFGFLRVEKCNNTYVFANLCRKAPLVLHSFFLFSHSRPIKNGWATRVLALWKMNDVRQENLKGCTQTTITLHWTWTANFKLLQKAFMSNELTSLDMKAYEAIWNSRFMSHEGKTTRLASP